MSATLTVPTEDHPNIETMKRVGAVVVWEDERAKLKQLHSTAETLTVTSADDKAGMKLARATRLTLKELRCAVENKRKELVTDGKKRLAAIDADAKEIRDAIEPLETRLLEQEQFAEREITRQKEELREMRAEELAPFGIDPRFYDLAEMPEEAYATLFNTSKSAHEAKLAAAAKAEADRLAQEEAERVERARLIAENIRLQEESAKAEAAAMAERVRVESERKVAQAKADAEAAKLRAEAERQRVEAAAAARAAEAEAQRQRDAIEAKARAERAEADRIAAEKIKAAGLKAKAEREAREKVERELAEKKAAEQAKIDADLAAQEAAAKAPDKNKLMDLADRLSQIPLPEMATKGGESALGRFQVQFDLLLILLAKEAREL